jgi:hypothetical protein
MARTFDINDTVAIADFDFPVKSHQEAKAREVNAERILKWRYAYDLPKYVHEALAAHGYKATQIGYTTYKSTTWALHR